MNNQSTIPAICFGEVLWDILPDGPQPGGAPLNVAYHLNKLGVPTSIVSKVGNDIEGRKLKDLFSDWRIDQQFLQVDDSHHTGEVKATIKDGTDISYEILYPVAWDYIEESNEVKKKIAPSTYIVYGSLASRNEVTRKSLFDLLTNGGIKVFDINLRPPFIGNELLHKLLEKADIVKFNQAELEIVQDLFEGDAIDEAGKVKFVMENFNVKEIIVTKGEHGASYYRGDSIWHIGGCDIQVQDTIGSGDSFLAAFVAGHSLNENPEKILKNAIAMGAFIATKKGGCPEYKINDFKEFKNQIF
jgi:fructokinase